MCAGTEKLRGYGPQPAIERSHRTPQRCPDRSPPDQPVVGLEPVLAALFEPAVRRVDRNPAVEEIQDIQIPFAHAYPRYARGKRLLEGQVQGLLVGCNPGGPCCGDAAAACASPSTTAWRTAVSVSNSTSMASGKTFLIAGTDEAPRRVAIVTLALLKSASISRSAVFSVFATRKVPVALYGAVKLTLRCATAGSTCH